MTLARMAKLPPTRWRMAAGGVRELTLLGQTRPVTLDVALNQKAPHPFSGTPTAGFTATGAIQRSQWGLDYATPAVSDEIDLTIETELALVTDDGEDEAE